MVALKPFSALLLLKHGLFRISDSPWPNDPRDYARKTVNGCSSKSEERLWFISMHFDVINAGTHLIYHLALSQHCFRRLSVLLYVSGAHKASQCRV